MAPKLAFTAESNSSAALNLQIKVDESVVFDGTVTEPVQITPDIDDDEGTHVLTISLSGKTSADTTIDSTGNIIEDAVIKCSNFTIDNVNIDLLISELATYTHNFNGSAEETVSKFYGIMGCNGIVRLEFTTPIYLWLLENT